MLQQSRRLQIISDWIDNAEANAKRDPEARTWGRLSKVAEESGEVISAYIGVTGQNPRKGVEGTIEDVKKELLDVAITALAAYQHMAPNSDSWWELSCYIDSRMERVGLTTNSQPTNT